MGKVLSENRNCLRSSRQRPGDNPRRLWNVPGHHATFPARRNACSMERTDKYSDARRRPFRSLSEFPRRQSISIAGKVTREHHLPCIWRRSRIFPAAPDTRLHAAMEPRFAEATTQRLARFRQLFRESHVASCRHHTLESRYLYSWDLHCRSVRIDSGGTVFEHVEHELSAALVS